ncbi:uncharacterized protein C8R40DRAFT_1164993 [Lentinula edodes]|uniref:uncharacterized protein n=1 Tax=Lentinula edodes TaxID=5353 RepID=UPI001E8CEABC|nr:uncharacterized protein C8R40DRAFT_1164993 [Lentinula edodes]KAH7881584.1 hypothetical protein C8R40DRAFT_1164993 [Lentinula edodes]
MAYGGRTYATLAPIYHAARVTPFVNLMSSPGLNARRFTLPDSSEPDLYKGKNKRRIIAITNSTLEAVISETEFSTRRPTTGENQERSVAGYWDKCSISVIWLIVVTTLRTGLNIVRNNRATFLITLPLVSTYLVQEFFPSVHTPENLIRPLCTTVGLICSCGLPDLFAPLSSINCNADYYHGLCIGPSSQAPLETPSLSLLPTTSIPLPPVIAQADKDSDVSNQLVSLDPIYPSLDFGLADSGAKALLALTSPTEGIGSLSYMARLIAVIRGYDTTQMHINPPRVVLEEQLSVHNCWKLAGSRGHIAIALSDTIIWSHFAVHFPDYLGITEVRLRQAPKTVVMWALVLTENVEVEARSLLTDWDRFVTVKALLDSSIFNSSCAFMEVARFIFKPSDGSRQIFPTQIPIRTSVVLVEILDNWGDESTCLHRVSFHSENVAQ